MTDATREDLAEELADARAALEELAEEHAAFVRKSVAEVEALEGRERSLGLALEEAAALVRELRGEERPLDPFCPRHGRASRPAEVAGLRCDCLPLRLELERMEGAPPRTVLVREALAVSCDALGTLVDRWEHQGAPADAIEELRQYLVRWRALAGS